MKKITKLFIIAVIITSLVIMTSCSKKFTVKFVSDDELYKEVEVKKDSTVEEITISKEGYEFLGWFKGEEKFDFDTKITDNVELTAKWKTAKATFDVNGSLSFPHNGTTKLTIKYSKTGEKPKKIDWIIENEDIAVVDDKNNTSLTLFGVKPGSTNVTVVAKYEDGNTSEKVIKVVVEGQTFDIEYKLNENDALIFPNDAPKEYNTAELPLKLPTLEREFYTFAGWTIEGYEGVYTSIAETDFIEGNLVMSPKWIYPHLELDYENSNVTVEVEGTNQLVVTGVDLNENELNGGYVYSSLNEKVATISADGVITGIKAGYAEIIVKVKNNQKISSSIGITVLEQGTSLNEVLDYFVSVAKSNNIVKNIKVTGWQRIYQYELKTSVIGYLFEDLVITENIAPLGNGVRPGTIYKKEYICVHDTGDVDYSAKDWSETVYNNFNSSTGQEYGASYQYVIDNKDCYHNIPDNERSYHAGDGNRTYEEVPSGVYGTNEHPEITITDDGYYAIDGKKSTIVAPTYNGKILKTTDINDYGVRCVINNGQYYLGKTWYSETYRKIGNYGGNNNSIGIESCITEGEDVYYTWQRLAKLVAKLMDENDLTIDDVVTHHYFSGKNCPQTMREAGFYMHFKELVQIEYQILQYIKMGYKVSLESNNPEYVNNSGRVLKTTPIAKVVSYRIIVEKDGVQDSVVLTTTVQNTPLN